MAVLKNRAKMSTSTTGTGTITLGSAESGYQTFADAGVADADVVRYVIEDGAAWEIGTGTYTATGTTLTRTVSESSNADAAITLTGSAVVFVGAAAEDIYTDADVDTHLNTGTATTGEVLSWSGTDYDWIAAGGAALELYAENPVTPTAPSATGTNAFAIGSGASVSSTDGIALGKDSSATGSFRSIAIGRLSVSSGISSVAIGYGATATSTEGNAFGRDSHAVTGAGATAIAKSYASGADSFAAAIGNSGSSYGATGANSIAMGQRAKAVDGTSVAIGQDSSAANGGYAFGLEAVASGTQSFAAGAATDATAAYATALGRGAQATHQGSTAVGYLAATTTTNQVAVGAAGHTVKISTLHETVGTITTGTIDLATGNVFADAPATNATYVFSNPAASGLANGFTLKITPSATVTITWPASVDWAAATAPDAPASGDTNVYTFYTTDGGTTYYGFLAGGAMG